MFNCTRRSFRMIDFCISNRLFLDIPTFRKGSRDGSAGRLDAEIERRSGDGQDWHLQDKLDGYRFSSRRRLASSIQGTRRESLGVRRIVRFCRARTGFRTSHLNSFGRVSSLGGRDSLNDFSVCFWVNSFKRRTLQGARIDGRDDRSVCWQREGCRSFV